MFEDGSIFSQLLLERLNYFIYVVLLLIGLWAMIAKNNLIKKLIGMSIFQTAIILFYVSIGVKEGATIPIYLPEHDPHGNGSYADSNVSESTLPGPQSLDASLVPHYTNPLPHVLMLTAIVVGVATLGLALSVCLRIYRAYGTVEEDELLGKLEEEDSRKDGLPKKRRPRRRSPSNKSGSSTKNKEVAGSRKSSPEKKKPGRNRNPSNRKKPSDTASTESSPKDTGTEKKKPVRRKRRNPSNPSKEDRSS
jgi:multicomponent Na+:H+ antiporter subunit C